MANELYKKTIPSARSVCFVWLLRTERNWAVVIGDWLWLRGGSAKFS